MPACHTEELYLDLLKKALTASVYPESGWKALGRERDPSIGLRTPRAWLRGRARDLLARVEARSGLLLVKRVPFDPVARHEGRDWPLFGYTMIGSTRLDHLRACIESVLAEGVAGDLVEAGSWRGGATIFMRGVLKAKGVADRTVWVADSFAGLPAPDRDNALETGPDLSRVTYLKVSVDEVKANFARFGLLDDQVRFLEGWFDESLPAAPVERIALLRVDADLYDSTLAVLRHLHPRVSPGGYVIVDDYHHWPGCKEAVATFLRESGIEVDPAPVDWGSAYWRVPDGAR